MIDTEAVVGALAAKLNVENALFTATKVWTTGHDAGIQQMEASMRKLRSDPIDLMQAVQCVGAW